MSTANITIRKLTDQDREAAVGVINTAARWYDEIVPDSELGDVEMTAEEWSQEAQRLTWFGAFTEGQLIGVIGREYVSDVALLRHWYVLPDHQRSGAGSLLREHLEADVTGVDTIVAGTYAANFKARSALERSGYRLSSDSQAVLRAYYDIPDDRRASSVTYERSVRP